MVSAYTMAFGGICASATLHLELINNTLHGPLLFFERTPLGRILNRFTEDMATIDFVIPFTIRSMINCVLQMTGTLCVIGVNTPVCLATVPPLALLYYGVQVLPVSRHENRCFIVKPRFYLRTIVLTYLVFFYIETSILFYNHGFISCNHGFIVHRCFFVELWFVVEPWVYLKTMVLFSFRGAELPTQGECSPS